MIEYLIAAYVVGMVFFLVWRLRKWLKARKIKIQVLVLHKTRDYEMKNVSVDKEDKLNIEKDWMPNVENAAVFVNRKDTSKRLIIFPHGKNKPVNFKTPESDELDEFTERWTPKEALSFIKKELAKAKAQISVISRLEFFILLMFDVVILICLFVRGAI